MAEPLTHDEEAALRSVLFNVHVNRRRPWTDADVERLLATLDVARAATPDPVGLREALDTPENHDPEGHDALPDRAGLREALTEWGKGFLDGLSFNVPTLQENGWAERRAPDIAGSILSDAGVRAALLSQPTPLDVERRRAFVDGYANGRVAPKDAEEAGREAARLATEYAARLRGDSEATRRG